MLAPDPQRIVGQLEGDFFRVRCLDVTPSTNEEIKDAARVGEREGLACMALEQRAGYGRQGRCWASPLGGMYVSLLLEPVVERNSLPTLSLVVSLAVRRALLLLGCGEEVIIKWPNDVLCARGKLCGISLETIGDAVCVGIGLNVFRPVAAPLVEGKNIPAYLSDDAAWVQDRVVREKTVHSVLSENQIFELERVAAAVLNSIDLAYHRWLCEGFAGFAAAYNAHLSLVGTQVTVDSVAGDTLAQGKVDSVDEAGRLLLRISDGSLRAVVSGEVHLR
ncbi:MAG: biotin--[acetyl-CoA-carboxylase] ligase [Raoultibacter sp.]